MRIFMIFAAIAAFSLPTQAADPEAIHILMASRVVGNINGEEGAELSPWLVNINLMKDVKDGVSNTSYTVRFNKLNIDGVKYDHANSSLPDAHHEVMQWYSLNWPVGVSEEKDGVIDLVPLKGKQRTAHEKSFSEKNQKVRADIVNAWPAGWHNANLDTMRILNGKPKIVRESFNPPGKDSKPFQRPRIEVPTCPSVPPKID